MESHLEHLCQLCLQPDAADGSRELIALQGLLASLYERDVRRVCTALL